MFSRHGSKRHLIEEPRSAADECIQEDMGAVSTPEDWTQGPRSQGRSRNILAK